MNWSDPPAMLRSAELSLRNAAGAKADDYDVASGVPLVAIVTGLSNQLTDCYLHPSLCSVLSIAWDLRGTWIVSELTDLLGGLRLDHTTSKSNHSISASLFSSNLALLRLIKSPVSLSGGSSLILTHTYTHTLHNKREKPIQTTLLSLHFLDFIRDDSFIVSSSPVIASFPSIARVCLPCVVSPWLSCKQASSAGFLWYELQPTLAQLRKAGMSRTGTLRVRALTRRLRSSVRRTTSLWSLTVPSVYGEH